MPNLADFEVRILIAYVRAVFELDPPNPHEKVAALEMLAFALGLIDDSDSPIEVKADDEYGADGPRVRS